MKEICKLSNRLRTHRYCRLQLAGARSINPLYGARAIPFFRLPDTS